MGGKSFQAGSGSLKCSYNVIVDLWTYFYCQPFALLVVSFESQNDGSVFLNKICVNFGVGGDVPLSTKSGAVLDRTLVEGLVQFWTEPL